jgi:hypothetical protein
MSIVVLNLVTAGGSECSLRHFIGEVAASLT